MDKLLQYDSSADHHHWFAHTPSLLSTLPGTTKLDYCLLHAVYYTSHSQRHWICLPMQAGLERCLPIPPFHRKSFTPQSQFWILRNRLDDQHQPDEITCLSTSCW